MAVSGGEPNAQESHYRGKEREGEHGPLYCKIKFVIALVRQVEAVENNKILATVYRMTKENK